MDETEFDKPILVTGAVLSTGARSNNAHMAHRGPVDAPPVGDVTLRSGAGHLVEEHLIALRDEIALHEP